MSKIANSEGASESEKPVQNDVVQFPPFPDPKDEDFDDDIGQEERNYYQTLFKDLNDIKNMRLHCSACDGHMGCSARNEMRMRAHPMLRTLVCHNCHIFYNSGEFEKGDDGSELYCRWCGQGGQVYCCSDCPHVFCAKCIKRNMGVPKIKEIENTDDWKCFKCNPRCLWDLRALCWAVLRYCDLKNKITNQTEDVELKEAYKKDCAIDYSECCRHKKRSQKTEIAKKKEIKKETDSKSAANIISKIPSTIQVKKFAAAVNMDEPVKPDKKPQKRPQSPSKLKSVLVKNPISVAPCPKVINPISTPPVAKKMRMPNPLIVNTPRLLNANERKAISTYTRIRPKPPQLPIPIGNSSYNGFSVGIYNTAPNDNINLSLESLTQGLDMSAVATVTAISQNFQDDDVVCTPDFPLEPLCEVTEDNDDDVQCITPGPVVAPKLVSPSPIVHRPATLTADVTSDNIIQMTDNDVTVNAATGGLKFRVDPQTLSSNKMYRLPDGRIFAINANPNMPGGYSATIVAVTEPTGKTAPKGATYAAKLSSVTTSTPLTPPPKPNRSQPRILKRSTPKTAAARLTKLSESSTRECDLKVPVEWYRYNLIDAVDALEYALSRLNKLKKEATTVHLRTRTLNEMRNLHRTLERLLNTSSNRFGEIRDNLNKGLKQYVLRKSGGNISEDDDDVEILPDMDDADDPIFIDENSMESNVNSTEHQEVDLTGAGSSEYNDSGENNKDNASKIDADSLLNESQNDIDNIEHSSIIPNIINNNIILHCTDNITEKEKLKRVETEKHVESEKSFSDNMVNEHASNNVVEENVKEDNLKNNDTENKLDKIDKENIVNNTVTEDIVVQTVNKNEIEQNITQKELIKNVDTNISVQDSITDDTEKNNDSGDNNKMEIDTVVNELTHLASLGNEITNNKTKTDEVNGEMTDSKTNIDKEDSGPVRLDNLDSEDCMPQKDLNDKADSQDSDDKMQDTEMSEEMIETLLKDDNIDDSESNLNSMDVPVLQET